jgi:hypothetical protein
MFQRTRRQKVIDLLCLLGWWMTTRDRPHWW